MNAADDYINKYFVNTPLDYYRNSLVIFNFVQGFVGYYYSNQCEMEKNQ